MATPVGICFPAADLLPAFARADEVPFLRLIDLTAYQNISRPLAQSARFAVWVWWCVGGCRGWGLVHPKLPRGDCDLESTLCSFHCPSRRFLSLLVKTLAKAIVDVDIGDAYV